MVSLISSDLQGSGGVAGMFAGVDINARGKAIASFAQQSGNPLDRASRVITRTLDSDPTQASSDDSRSRGDTVTISQEGLEASRTRTTVRMDTQESGDDTTTDTVEDIQRQIKEVQAEIQEAQKEMEEETADELAEDGGSPNINSGAQKLQQLQTQLNMLQTQLTEAMQQESSTAAL